MYAALDDGNTDGGAEEHDEALERMGKKIGNLRLCMQWLSIGAWILVFLLFSACGYASTPAPLQPTVRRYALLASIPIVALFFTWFHIWLAIQMMFRPIKFIGIWQYKQSGIGIGWQGVVPRKSLKMAKTAYACARPYLQTPKQWLCKVDASLLIAKTRPQLTRVVNAALSSVVRSRFPDVHQRIPPEVQEELVVAAVDKIQEMNPVFWSEITEILCEPGDRGIDNDGMVVNVFQHNKELLNHFFFKLGEKEFKFIEHCGAALGFFCGVVQLFVYHQLDEVGREIFLPSTGFFLGILTNYLAIQMCFRPVFPTPFPSSSWQLCTVQGLFLKRQRDVATLYSKMLCDHFFEFSKVLSYLQTLPPLWERLKNAYTRHNGRVFDQTLGRIAKWLAPLAMGRREFESLQDDMTYAMAVRIAEASDMQEKAGRYIAEATDVFRSNADAMQRMPPNEFENLLHPVFQEDEWILILLGGVLGAIVGFAQVHCLAE